MTEPIPRDFSPREREILKELDFQPYDCRPYYKESLNRFVSESIDCLSETILMHQELTGQRATALNIKDFMNKLLLAKLAETNDLDVDDTIEIRGMVLVFNPDADSDVMPYVVLPSSHALVGKFRGLSIGEVPSYEAVDRAMSQVDNLEFDTMDIPTNDTPGIYCVLKDCLIMDEAGGYDHAGIDRLLVPISYNGTTVDRRIYQD